MDRAEEGVHASLAHAESFLVTAVRGWGRGAWAESSAPGRGGACRAVGGLFQGRSTCGLPKGAGREGHMCPKPSGSGDEPTCPASSSVWEPAPSIFTELVGWAVGPVNSQVRTFQPSSPT